MVKVELSKVTKSFDGKLVLDKISLTVEDGEILLSDRPFGCR